MERNESKSGRGGFVHSEGIWNNGFGYLLEAADSRPCPVPSLLGLNDRK